MKMINPLLFTILTALCLGVPQVNAQTAMSAESSSMARCRSAIG